MRDTKLIILAVLVLTFALLHLTSQRLYTEETYDPCQEEPVTDDYEEDWCNEDVPPEPQPPQPPAKNESCGSCEPILHPICTSPIDPNLLIPDTPEEALLRSMFDPTTAKRSIAIRE